MTDDDAQIDTTHIGSLPRPPELLELLTKRQDGEDVDEAEWDATVAEATRDVVDRQVETGLGAIGSQPLFSSPSGSAGSPRHRRLAFAPAWSSTFSARWSWWL